MKTRKIKGFISLVISLALVYHSRLSLRLKIAISVTNFTCIFRTALEKIITINVKQRLIYRE